MINFNGDISVVIDRIFVSVIKSNGRDKVVAELRLKGSRETCVNIGTKVSVLAITSLEFKKYSMDSQK